jgi:hypothetical protein
MKTLTLNIEPSPTSDDHQVRIQIDGQDWLGKDFLGIDPPRFFSQSTLTTGGEAIIGRCKCGIEGCDDYTADIIVENSVVIWKMNKGHILHFEKTAYLTLIKNAANDFSWESKERTAERRVGEIFKDTRFNDEYRFDWASAQINPGKILLSFSKEASQMTLEFDWADENPDTAVASALQYKKLLRLQ